MVDYIRPKDLPEGVGPQPTGLAIPGDNGIEVVRVTPAQIVATGRPIATESQAIAGTDNTTTMTPLTTAQAMDSRLPGVMQPYVDLAQAWAESPTNPDPANMDSKSAKTWAGEAAISAAQAALYYTGPRFDTIQSLLTNASMSYGATPGGVSAGDFITTDQEAQAYQVVASGSASYDVVTTGGVRLIVLPTPRGFNIRAFGAVGDNTGNDGPMIQSALAAAETRGIAQVYAPSGTYRMTSPITLPGTVALIGDGPLSQFYVVGSNFMNIGHSDGIAPRSISDFQVFGDGSWNYVAFFADLAYPSQRATGLIFERLHIHFMGYGVRARGLWRPTFRSVQMHEAKTGFDFYGKNIKVLIDDCRVDRPSRIFPLDPGETAKGVIVRDGDGGATDFPENVRVINSIIFGYDEAIRWEHCLSGAICNNDLDAFRRTGVWVGKAHGGLTISDNWFAMNYPGYGTPVGILAESAATAVNQVLVDIHGNNITTNTSNAAEVGIAVQQNHMNFHIHDNAISWGGVSISEATDIWFEDNRVVGAANFTSTTGLRLAGNTLTSSVVLGGNIDAEYGKNRGVTTRTIGQTTMPAGEITITRTWAELGIDPLPTAVGVGYGVIVEASDQGSVSRGVMRADYSTTGITIYAQNAVGSAAGVNYEISVI